MADPGFRSPIHLPNDPGGAPSSPSAYRCGLAGRMTRSMPKFIVQFQGQESTAELKPGANSIGRQSSCTIPLKDSTLSRLHCEVILAGTVATLVDKGSRNGTLLNGKKIEAQVLQPGDKIQIGATTLWYEKKNVAAEAPKTTSVAPTA